MFAYPTSPSSGQICVRLTDTQPVTWCDQEMECWRQCLRRSPPSDHQGPGTTRGHQGNLLHKTPGASWTFPVSQHLQGSLRENMLCKLCKYMRIFLTVVLVLDQNFCLKNIQSQRKGEKVNLKFLRSFQTAGFRRADGVSSGGTMRGPWSIQNWSVFIQNRSAWRCKLPVVSQLMTASEPLQSSWAACVAVRCQILTGFAPISGNVFIVRGY